MSTFHPTSLFDNIFEGGILIKGATGLLELIGGLLFLFVSPATIHHFVALITLHEITEDPHDKFSNLLLHSTQHIGTGSRAFIAGHIGFIPTNVKVIRAHEPFVVHGVQVTPLPAYHMPGADDDKSDTELNNMFGFLLEHGGKKIAYLADY
jgi:hypothetical protein